MTDFIFVYIQSVSKMLGQTLGVRFPHQNQGGKQVPISTCPQTVFKVQLNKVLTHDQTCRRVH
jgi:hypothetical protein